MKYPKHEIYEKLYERYFDKGVDYLIKEANIHKTDKVLDVCGGNGRLSRELKKYSNNIYYLDQEKDMIPDDLEQDGIIVYNEPIQNFINESNEKFDKVFCQQAINYWLLHIDVSKFSNLIKKDGLFIFNTFSNKPSEKPSIKNYEINDTNCMEISYLVDNVVNHIQIREGFEPHFTKFDWISKEKYMELLAPYFDIKLNDDGKTSVYICRRK